MDYRVTDQYKVSDPLDESYEMISNDMVEKTMTSHWYQSIEDVMNRTFLMSSMEFSNTLSEMLHNELNILCVCKKFAEAAEKATILLVHCLLGSPYEKRKMALETYGFMSASNPSVRDVSSLYLPLFDQDDVFFWNGIVLTVIHGGRFLSPSDSHHIGQCFEFSNRDAEKIYSTVSKCYMALMHTVIRFSRLEAQCSSKVLSRFSLPVVALVQYGTLRIFVEPLMPVTPLPIDLSIFRLKDLSEQDIQIRDNILKDTLLIRQINFIQENLGLKTHPFPCLVTHIGDSENIQRTLGVVSMLINPQFLYSLPFRKITVRRVITLLPCSSTPPLYSNAHLTAALLQTFMVNRLRPEILWCLNESSSKSISSSTDILSSHFGKFERLELYRECEDKKVFPCVDVIPSKISVVPQSHLGSQSNETVNFLDALFPIMVCQIKEMLILVRDSGDISRAFHSLGLPLRYLLKLYYDPKLPLWARDVLYAELIARASRHWFFSVARSKMLESSGPFLRDFERDLEKLVSELFRSIHHVSSFCSTVIYPLILRYWTSNDFSPKEEFCPGTIYPHLLKGALEAHFGIVINPIVLTSYNGTHTILERHSLEDVFSVMYLDLNKSETNFIQKNNPLGMVESTIFKPQLRLVAPEGCLPITEAAESTLRDYLNNNQRLGTVGQIIRSGYTSMTVYEAKSKERLLISAEPYISHKLNLNTLCNITTFGLLSPRKKFMYDAVSPCHPHCIQTMGHSDQLDLQTLGLGFPMESSFSQNTLYLMNQKQLSLCQRFVQIWTAIRVLSIARQCFGDTWVYCSGTMHERGNFKIFLSLGYLYFHHKYYHYARDICENVLQDTTKGSSRHVYAMELATQCYSVLGLTSKVEENIAEFTSGMSIKEMNERSCSSTDLLTIYFLFFGLASDAFEKNSHTRVYTFSASAVSLSEILFRHEKTHWCHINILFLLLCSGYHCRKLKQSKLLAFELLKLCQFTPYVSLILTSGVDYLLSQIYNSLRKWKHSAQRALEAIHRLSKACSPLLPLIISCLYEAAYALHQWGTCELDSVFLKSVVLIKTKHWCGVLKLSLFPSCVPEYMASDNAVLVKLFSQKHLKKAREGALDIYDSLFQRVIAKMQQAMLHPATIYNGGNTFSSEENTFSSLTMAQKPPVVLYDYSIPDAAWKPNLSRLMSLLESIMVVKLYSLSFSEQKCLVNHFIDFFKRIPTSKRETIERSSEGKKSQQIEDLWNMENWDKILAVIKPSHSRPFVEFYEYVLIINYLYHESHTETKKKLLYFVLGQCCSLPSNCASSEIRLVLTPKKWFNSVLEKVFDSEGLDRYKMCLFVFFIIRECCSKTFKKILVFHMFTLTNYLESYSVESSLSPFFHKQYQN